MAVIAGDGVGQEVMPPAITCVDAALARHGHTIEWTHLDWGSDLYLRTGSMMPRDGLDLLSSHQAIFLGAVGMPGVPDTETLWGLLIPIRRAFEQYVNLRPVRSLPGITSPVAGGDALDLVIVRENNEGEYSEIGGRAYRDRAQEMAIQVDVFTRAGITKVAEFAAGYAAHRRGLVTSATKSNGIIHSMPFWDEVTAQVCAANGVELESVLIDALVAKLVLQPSHFDVIVASNLFGDILSDLAGAIAGSIGVAPSANLNPERTYPSLFEPVHGSAPDIAGQGIANPIGQVWSGAMMLDHLGQHEAAADLVAAFEAVLARGIVTRDLGGTASTDEVGDAIVAELTA
ncbi:tartrate dehydrogenase [Microbacterium sp. NFH-22A-Y]|uniref:tartrate dehydrogenase n=1 Tax=Microbacterium sp. NFH-22A-Y TaxID=2744448 RepID=UPI0027E1C8A3|nr:tartrate dehydrogenase [Microbacterium sp. NFH-22A-Y]